MRAAKPSMKPIKISILASGPCSRVSVHSLFVRRRRCFVEANPFFTNRCLSKKPSMGWTWGKRSGCRGGKSTLGFRLGDAAVAAVGAHDGLDELVPDDVAIGE